MKDYFVVKSLDIDKHGAIWLGEKRIAKNSLHSEIVILQKANPSLHFNFRCDRRLPALKFLEAVELAAVVNQPASLIVIREEPDATTETEFIPSLPGYVTNSITLTRTNAEIRVMGMLIRKDSRESIRKILLRLAELDRSIPVIIIAGETDSLQDIVDLVDECHQVRLNGIHIVREGSVFKEVFKDSQQDRQPSP